MIAAGQARAMKIYHLKTCDTCRKARKLLADRDPAEVELREDGVPRAVLARWLDAVGAETLVNRRSTTWRNLSGEERALEPADLLARHPTLIKRPVVELDGEILVGWSPAVQARLGL